MLIIQVGRKGWVAASMGGATRYYVRFAETGDRMVPVELHLSDPGGVAAVDLRAVPLRSLEAWANSKAGRYELDDAPTGPEARELVKGFAAGLDLERFDQRRGRPQLQLAPIPQGGRHPDRFYERVAAAYGWLAPKSKRPAAELAEINGVPVSTVHGWLKRARRRGLMGPGRRGGAG